MSDQDIWSNLLSRQTLFRLLREAFAQEPRDEAGIKLCDEWIDKLVEQSVDAIINGTGDLNKEPIGIIHLK